MISALAVIICCCYISGVIGRSVPENTTQATKHNASTSDEKELIKEFTNYLNQPVTTMNSEIMIMTKYGNKSNLEASNNKINESELYENAQEVKENNERSFILINQKFKSQWFDAKRPGSSKNLLDTEQGKRFDSPTSLNRQLNQANNEANSPGHTNQDRNNVQNIYAYKSVPPYYTPYHAVPIRQPSGKEHVELLKKPLLRPSSGKMGNSIIINGNQDFRSRKKEASFFNDEGDSVIPKLAVQNDQPSGDYKYKQQKLQCSTTKPKTVIDNFIPVDLDNDAKLNQYLSDVIRRQLIDNDMAKNRYNCYNASCDTRHNKQENIYNGILHGRRCVCPQAPTHGRHMHEAPGQSRLLIQEASPQDKMMRQGAQGRLLRQGINRGRRMQQKIEAEDSLLQHEGRARNRLMRQEVPTQGRPMRQQAPPQGKLMQQQAPPPGSLMRQDFETIQTKTTTEDNDTDDKIIKEIEKLSRLTDTITN